MLARSNRFTQMVWAGTSRVAFGVKSPWVVAWYCPAGNDPAVGETGSASAYKENVAKTCMEEGRNVCYNERALAAHNAARLLHQDTPALEMYPAAAAAIQAAMDAPDFAGVMPAASERTAAFQDCAESVFEAASAEEIAAAAPGDLATRTWYD